MYRVFGLSGPLLLDAVEVESPAVSLYGIGADPADQDGVCLVAARCLQQPITEAAPNIRETHVLQIDAVQEGPRLIAIS